MHFLMVLRQDFQTLEIDAPDLTVHDAVSTLRRDGGNESGLLLERFCQ